MKAHPPCSEILELPCYSALAPLASLCQTPDLEAVGVEPLPRQGLFSPLGSRRLGWSHAKERKMRQFPPLKSGALWLSAGPGVTHVIVREDPCYSSGAPLAMGMLAGAATGAALGSLMWSPCWF